MCCKAYESEDELKVMHIHSWPLVYLRIRGHENIGLPIVLSVPRGLKEIHTMRKLTPKLPRILHVGP